MVKNQSKECLVSLQKMDKVKFDLLKQDVACFMGSMSYREFAEQSGISASTINRFVSIKESQVYFRNLVKLCNTIGKPVSKYIGDSGTGVVYYESDNTLEKIRVLLQSDKTLTQEARDFILNIMTITYNGFVKS